MIGGHIRKGSLRRSLFFSGGGAMTRGEMAEIAMRYDTALSRAMLKALGVARRAKGRASARLDAYKGIGWCFVNHGSPMDR